MKKTVGFGDFLLRLNPPGYRRFAQTNTFECYYTGAEANVCASLAVMGAETEFVTRVPDNDIARAGLGELKRLDVGVSHVVFGGERIGIFYLEKGASQRASKVVYDRKYTSIATASPGDFDWKAIFRDAGYFHFTGITPALGEGMPAVVEAACRAAKDAGAQISCDLNFRRKLWTSEQAGKVMSRLLAYVDTLVANEEDADKVLGIRADDTDVLAGKLSRSGYEQVAARLVERFPNIRRVGITLRQSISASDNIWGAMLYTDGKAYFSREYPVHIVDRVGGGDSFAAGLLFGIGHDMPPQECIEYAAAASCLKHSIELDVNLATEAEIRQLMNGDGSGRVQR